jgi:hypothetical protein
VLVIVVLGGLILEGVGVFILVIGDGEVKLDMKSMSDESACFRYNSPSYRQ